MKYDPSKRRLAFELTSESLAIKNWTRDKQLIVLIKPSPESRLPLVLCGLNSLVSTPLIYLRTHVPFKAVANIQI